MLRLNQSIRLTSNERRRLQLLTTIEPVGIKCAEDLQNYIARAKATFKGSPKAIKELFMYIDEEAMRCLSNCA